MSETHISMDLDMFFQLGYYYEIESAWINMPKWILGARVYTIYPFPSPLFLNGSDGLIHCGPFTAEQKDDTQKCKDKMHAGLFSVPEMGDS